MDYLPFEQAILDTHTRAEKLRESLIHTDIDSKDRPRIEADLEKLHIKEKRELRQLYRNLDPWQRVQVARHAKRPQMPDYAKALVTNFQPLAGDRSFADDPALVAGLGTFAGRSVALIGTRKGTTTAERVKYSFGMPKPEGYRKAQRIAQLAGRFNLPLITFVDTPGAFPGVDAEARGQSQAIAACISTMLSVDVPVVSVITGEGGSGGALAIAVSDRTLMLENSVYSVISPEGCASILWRDAASAAEAAQAMRLTAKDLKELGVVDTIIREPVGGAHRDPQLAMRRVAEAVESALVDLPKGNRHLRRERYLAMGALGE